MHPALYIPEILLDIFGYGSTEPLSGRRNYLARLARTCRTFKEPALDFLWEELDNLSPLACCLPETYYLVEPYKTEKQLSYWQNKPCYTFSRPLTEVEWNTLRGYTRRVRFIRGSSLTFAEEAIRATCSLAPIDSPLFPHLRSLYWDGTATSALPHINVPRIVAPSLKILHLDFHYTPRFSTFEEPLSFNAVGHRYPHMESFEVDSFYSGSMNSAISDLVRCWSKLQRVACSNVALNMDAISHLSSVSSLMSLEFKAGIDLVQDISHLGSKLVFSSLTFLEITSGFLDTITSLFRYIQLPAIETLSVVVEGPVLRWAIQPYWAALREACPSNALTRLTVRSSVDESMVEIPDDEHLLPLITLNVLRPSTAFAQLRGLEIDFECGVSLSDTDILEIASPRMEYLLINSEHGWQCYHDYGITLYGLVQLLQKCPLLNRLCLAIDTRTFTEIPEGLDVSLLAQRRLEIDVVDSYILPEFVPDLVSVFTALKLDSSRVIVGFNNGFENALWESVLRALRDVS